MRRLPRACSMAETILQTERLVLHEWTEADWASFRAHTNTPACMRWLGGVADDAGWAAFRARVEQYQHDYGHTFWACTRTKDGGHLAGELIGMVGFKRSQAEGEPVCGMLEVGWRLREDAWGRGYAIEAASACLAYGFETIGGDPIIAVTVAGNVASWRLMERLGMERRADWDYRDDRFGPELNPSIVYAISRQQWENAQ